MLKLNFKRGKIWHILNTIIINLFILFGGWWLVVKTLVIDTPGGGLIPIISLPLFFIPLLLWDFFMFRAFYVCNVDNKYFRLSAIFNILFFMIVNPFMLKFFLFLMWLLFLSAILPLISFYYFIKGYRDCKK